MANELLITVRVFDPLEKKDPTLSACWETIKLDRAIIGASAEELAKQLMPVLKRLKNLKLT